jgi:DNA-binding NarL/FixJ family response regulator
MEINNIIRVIVADDHAMIRRGIRKILEKTSNICVVGEASTGSDALRLVQELNPDVLLLDMEMPGGKGIQVARELRAKKVPVSIIILTACDDDYFIREILQAGVDGFLHKSEPPSKIREVISQVSKKIFFGGGVASLMVVPLFGTFL